MGGVEIVSILGAWDRAADIDFTALPEKFVLKCNHGSGMNIIVKDKRRLNIRKTRRQLEKWLSVNYAYILGNFELNYSDITKKIIAEEYIQELDGNLHDYKIHCFNGVPKYIQLIGNRNFKDHTGWQMFYDVEWNRTGISTENYPPYADDFEKPRKLPQMLEIAKFLSKDFYYVRVDLYVINDKIYFGEMTFYPGSGLLKFNPPEADKMLGDLLTLPDNV